MRGATGNVNARAEEFSDGFHPVPAEGGTARVLAAVAALADEVGNSRKRQISGQMPGRKVRFARRRIVRLDDAEHVVEVDRQDAAATVIFVAPDEGSLTLQSSWRPGEPVWRGIIDGSAVVVQIRPRLNGVDLSYRGVSVAAHVYTELEAAAARLMPAQVASETGKAVRCPMPGLMVSIAVAEGQQVRAGETLAVVEAMKMQNVLRAERDGLVKRIHATPGDSLAVDAVILEFA